MVPPAREAGQHAHLPSTELCDGRDLIRAGTLDDKSAPEPKMHAGPHSKQPWTVVPEGVDMLERQP